MPVTERGGDGSRAAPEVERRNAPVGVRCETGSWRKVRCEVDQDLRAPTGKEHPRSDDDGGSCELHLTEDQFQRGAGTALLDSGAALGW